MLHSVKDKEPFTVIETNVDVPLILRNERIDEINADILKRNHIPAAYSDDVSQWIHEVKWFMDIQEVKNMMEQQGATILDVRRDQDFYLDHIKDAILINQKNVDDFLKSADKDKPLICYCYHDISSREAWRTAYPSTVVSS